jgi:AraC-like DNA-binding protein
VIAVALDLGYDSPSAFIHAFRRALGTTPRAYFGSVNISIAAAKS